MHRKAMRAWLRRTMARSSRPPPLRRSQQALYMVRGPGRALRARQRLPGHNQGCLCCAPPQSRSAWRFDPDALKKSGDDDDDGT